jgi:predicted DNA-binding transcriptional regulator AlpA
MKQVVQQVFMKAALREIGIPFSNPTLLRKEKRGEFPSRFYLSPKVPVWNAAEVSQWIVDRQAASSKPNTFVTGPATAAKARRRNGKVHAHP